MSVNGVNNAEDAEMADCEGGKVVTMMEFLQEQQEFEEDANAVLGASDEKNCTYPKGYIKRQAIYACLTCCVDSSDDPTKLAGICLACGLTCHENHDLVELYTKRNFRCDCGNPKLSSNPCQFIPNKMELNTDNSYNQNFSGLYCICHRPHPDPEAPEEVDMIQCIVCEDWLHATHLDATVPANDQYSEMICKGCMDKNLFLHDYSNFAVNVDPQDVDVLTVNNSSDKIVCNGDLEKENSSVNKVDLVLEIEQKPDSTNVTEDKVNDIESSDKVIEDEAEILGSKETSDVPMDDKLDSDKPDMIINSELNTEALKENKDDPEHKENEGECISESIQNKQVEDQDDTDKNSKTDNETLDELENNTNDKESIEVSSQDEKICKQTSDLNNKTLANESEVNEPIAKDETIDENEAAKSGDAENESTNKIDDKNLDIALNSTTEKEISMETDKTDLIVNSNAFEPSSEIKQNTVQNDNDDVKKDIQDIDSKPHEKDEISAELITDVSESKPDKEDTEMVDGTKNADDLESTNEVNTKANNKEHKRKLSTEDADEREASGKKPKLKLSTETEPSDEIEKSSKVDESVTCSRPRGVKKVYKGATFWPSNFRQILCTCAECTTMYKDLSVLFLTDPEDTVTAYETLGKEKINGAPTSQYEKGLEALYSLDRVQQINAVTEYNKMRDKFLDFLKNFKERNEIVKEEDIRAFFAGLTPKREPDGVYFCR